MTFLKWFKKQNRFIQYGYYSLVISFIALVIALILIGTANFVASDPNNLPVNSNLDGNGFQVMANNNISDFLSSSGYQRLNQLYTSGMYTFTSAPLLQLVIGIAFLVIVLPIFSGIALLLLASGYFKRWLYT